MKIVLKHIGKNIWEKKLRSLLIILALTIATTVFVLNLTLPNEIIVKVQETMRSIYGQVDVVVSTVEEFDIEDVNIGDEELDYTGVCTSQVLLGDKPASIFGLDIQKAKAMQLLGTDVLELKKNEVVMSEDQARKHGYSVGDVINVSYEDKEYELKLVKIVESKGIAAMSVEYPFFITGIETVNAINGIQGDKVSSLYINVKNDDNAKAYVSYLEENNENYQISMVADVETIKEEISFISYLMVMIFAMATIMIVFVVSSLNKIIITERMPVIGTFRSIGATKGKMNGILILENALYGLVGGVIGAFAGYGINSNVAGLFITTNGVELTKETAKMDMKIIAIGIIFSVLLQVVISLKSIFKSGRRSIKDIIFDVQSTRYNVKKITTIAGVILVILAVLLNSLLKDSNIVITILSIVLLISGAAMIVPAFMRGITGLLAKVFRRLGCSVSMVASRNVGYNKMIISSSRVVVVAVSLMIAIATVSVSFVNLFQSFRYMVDDYDIVIQNVRKDEEEYNKLLDIDGVAGIEFLHAYYEEAATFDGGNKFNIPPLIICEKKSRKYITELNYKIKDLKYDEILVDEKYAQKNGIEIGDVLTLELGSLGKEFELKVVGTVNSMNYTTSRNIIIMNYDNYTENVIKVPMQVQLKIEDGADINVVMENAEDKLKEVAVSIQTVEEYIAGQEESTASIMSLFYVIIGLAVILSFIGIINNQIIGFIQRRKEIAVLNSTCMGKGQIGRMLLMETVLANVLSCGLAILVSFLATDMIDSFLQGMSLYVEVKFSIATCLLFSGVILLILMFTLFTPLKKLRKMNIVEEIKYE